MIKSIEIGYLRSILDYHPETGEFVWRIRLREHFNCERGWLVFNSRFAGTPAGYRRKDDTILIRIDGVGYLAHRLAWAHHCGRWPTHEIDHIDGYPSHNWISNLREAAHSENMWNMRRHRDNITGFKGVMRAPHGKPYQAQICSNGKRYHLGKFDTAEEAHQAYAAASEKHHGEFGRLK